MKWVVKSILLLSLMSCSATWHLKRAVKKDPTILQKDTITVVDTTVLPPVGITDTVILQQHDTIRLVKDRLKVEIVKVNDTITIDAICDSDTIVTIVEIPYEKIVYVEKETWYDKASPFIIFMMLSFITIFILRLIRG